MIDTYNNSDTIVKAFADLTLDELYAILQARKEIFIQEQNCAYQDIDGYDKQSLHAIITYEGKLAAYCRIMPAGMLYSEWSIGRVLTLKYARKKKFGHKLITSALMIISHHGGNKIRISAQTYLKKFYESHGFTCKGNEYLEDDIPHIEMVLDISKSSV